MNCSDIVLSKKKSEQSEFFKEFKALYERQTDMKIKELRSDNSLEYYSNIFQQYLKDLGIKHNTSVAYAPQSNSKVRTMMSTTNLDLSMWGSADSS